MACPLEEFQATFLVTNKGFAIRKTDALFLLQRFADLVLPAETGASFRSWSLRASLDLHRPPTVKGM